MGVSLQKLEENSVSPAVRKRVEARREYFLDLHGATRVECKPIVRGPDGTQIPTDETYGSAIDAAVALRRLLKEAYSGSEEEIPVLTKMQLDVFGKDRLRIDTEMETRRRAEAREKNRQARIARGLPVRGRPGRKPGGKKKAT